MGLQLLKFLCCFSNYKGLRLVYATESLVLILLFKEMFQQTIFKTNFKQLLYIFPGGSFQWSSFSPLRLISLGSVVIYIFALSFGPFLYLVSFIYLIHIYFSHRKRTQFEMIILKVLVLEFFLWEFTYNKEWRQLWSLLWVKSIVWNICIYLFYDFGFLSVETSATSVVPVISL